VHWSKQRTRDRKRNIKFIKQVQVRELWEADRFAALTGRALCTFTTLVWKDTALGETNIATRQTMLVDALKRWAKRRHRITLAVLWVHENPPGKSFNTHWLTNIPPSLRHDFERELERLLRAYAGAVRVEPRVYPGKRDRRLNYMCKSAASCAPMRRRYKLIGASAQGIIDFKRCGTTQCLGQTARRRHAVEQLLAKPHSEPVRAAA
jgi:hypothetical protein